MQNRRINTNIAKTTFPASQPNDVRVNAVRRFSNCPLFSRIINAELTMRTAMLTPPPPINE